MDNVAHTLVGYSLGKIIGERKTFSEPVKRGVLWASVLASNLPDLDSSIGANRLTYLLHHRGWTHTILFIPLIAVIAAGIASLITKMKFKENWKSLGLAALLGVVFHIGTDFCNDYGVHPFAPWNNRWFYGDFLFILEPAVWFSMLPLIVLQSHNRLTKGLWLLIEFGMFFVVWFKPYTPLLVAIGLTFWLISNSWVQWRFLDQRQKSGQVAFLSFLAVLTVFFISSRVVKKQIQGMASVSTQILTSPAPSNPFCWRVMAMQGNQDEYMVHIGVASLAPQYFDPKTCFFRLSAERSAPLQVSTFAESERVHWIGKYVGSFAEMRQLSESHCDFRELLKFARVPFWKAVQGGYIVGDLRYDFNTEMGFAKFKTDSNYHCLGTLPPWDEPVDALTNPIEKVM